MLEINKEQEDRIFQKKELEMFSLYKHISIGVSVLVILLVVYILVWNKGITDLKMMVLLGLLVSCSFYFLLESNDKILQSRQDLFALNQRLREETRQRKHALEYTMNVYDALSLFSISNPQRVIEELNSMMYRTLAKAGTALFKINPLGEITGFAYEGVAEEEEGKIVKAVMEILKRHEKSAMLKGMMLDGRAYEIEYISNSSGTLSALLLLAREGSTHHGTVGDQFYLHLMEVIISQLDVQNMIESCIVCEEQNRIASEIHDTVIQRLFYGVCHMTELKEGLEKRSLEENKEKIEELIHLMESTMKTLREAIYGIRWDRDDENTLAHKLSSYIEEVQSVNNMEISLSFDEGVEVLAPHKKNAVYRIVCESVNNAVRYSQATKIQVGITSNQGYAITRIQDNGQGFKKSEISRESQGIKNMHILAGMLKGKLSIHSEDGRGTEIICKIPL